MTEQELIILVDEMKKIKLNFADLLEIAIDYSSKFVNDYPEKKEPIDVFFADKSFINQMTDAVRESTILALYAIMIDEKIDFKFLVKKFENKVIQTKVINQLAQKEEDKALLLFYFNELKKHVFETVYKRNKQVSKMSEIPKEILKERFNYFIENHNA